MLPLQRLGKGMVQLGLSRLMIRVGGRCWLSLAGPAVKHLEVLAHERPSRIKMHDQLPVVSSLSSSLL